MMTSPSATSQTKKLFAMALMSSFQHFFVVVIIVFFATPSSLNLSEAVESSSSSSSNSPPLSNLAVNRPITVLPSDVTCGAQIPTVYCQSTDSQDSLTNCLQSTCSSLCPWRSSTPSPSFLLQGDLSTGGSCIGTDPINVAPTNTSQSSVTFPYVGSRCYVTPLESANHRLGSNGSMTLTGWLWPSVTSGRGTVLDKYSTRKDGSQKPIVKLLVGPDGFSVAIHSSGYLQESAPVDLPPNTWSFVAVQIYLDRVSIFVNSTTTLQPKVTLKLSSALENEGQDEVPSIRIGQNFTGGEQYIGRMQDVRYYDMALSNREIEGVFLGSLPRARIQSECLCPGQYPWERGLDCFENDPNFAIGASVPRVSQSSHVIEMANDGDPSTYFLTNPVEGITMEIDLGDQFEIFFVKITFYSPLPDWLAMEKSENSYGDDFKAWQYYARDCYRSFNVSPQSPLVNSSSVNCMLLDDPGMPFLTGGSVTFNLLNPDRPGYQSPEQAPDLLEFMKAQRVRVTMSGHLPGLSLRHSYFGINEIEVMGRCDCHGHASSCNMTMPYVCFCLESSNSEGDKCQRCKPMYNDKPFTPGFPCQPCDCNNHSQSCSYTPSVDPFPTNNELGGGGVCNDCQDNTEGNNCQSCKLDFYRPEGISLAVKDVCRTCNCSVIGSTGVCNKTGGQCPCKENVEGRQCDRCKAGFFNLQPSNPLGCESCNCNPAGTTGGSSQSQCQGAQGQCPCKTFAEGLKCDRCQLGYHGLDANDPKGCRPCNCNAQRSLGPDCDQATGQCRCRENFSGLSCDTCIDNYYLLPTTQIGSCRPCNCDARGSIPGSLCNKVTGACTCQPYVIGGQCNTCMENYFNLTTTGCKPCNCYARGVANPDSICDVITGTCKCRPGLEGVACNVCKQGYFNSSSTTNAAAAEDKTLAQPCTVCSCDANGTLTCDPETGRCSCKPNRTGPKCDTCLIGYYDDLSGNCTPCVCDEAGSIYNSPCDPFTGQCQCKGGGSGVGGRSCDGCRPEYWGFDSQLGKCQSCDCDPSGSDGMSCDLVTGQCNCKRFTTSRQCNLCVEGTSNVNASNPFGCSKAPGGVKPVAAKELRSKFILLSWEPPSEPNGILQGYTILRNRMSVFNASVNVTEYNDTTLTAYTRYTYVLVARNDLGSTQSPPVTFETLQDVPEGSLDFKFKEVASRQAKLSWKSPNSSNGVVLRFIVRQRGGFNEKIRIINDSMPYAIRFQGLAFQAIIDSLTPYSNVTFDLQCCNVIGCLTSELISAITSEEAPANQSPPIVRSTNYSSLLVTWSPPNQPNGIIISYQLWMRKQLDGGTFDQSVLVFQSFGQYNPLLQSLSSLNPPITTHVANKLSPFTYYEFKVVSENSRGKTESLWAGNTTGEAAPSFVSPPNVTSINSSALGVSWSNKNSRLNGIVTSYVVCYAFGLIEPQSWKCIDVTPSTTSYVLQNLPPFTNVSVLITACNSVSCKNSSATMAMVLMSAPGEPSAPVVMPHNSTSFLISWEPPKVLNGPNPSYVVVRSHPSFSTPPVPIESGEGIVPFNGLGYYKLPADTIPQDAYYTGFKFAFRSTATDGLILLATTPASQIEYLAVYLENGGLTFAFNTQECPTVLKWSDGPLDMDTWKSVVILRLGNYASIQVDQGPPATTNSSCPNNMIGQNSGLYVGGLPTDFFTSDFSNLQNFKFKNFYGCLANLSALIQGYPSAEMWAPVDWQKVDQSKGNTPMWMGCKTNQQPGIRFLGTGHLTVRIESLDGRSLTDVFFIFESQSKTGVVLFAYEAVGSYYAVYMWEGFLNWNLSINGVMTNYVYDVTSLCDGKSHPIRLVLDLPSGFMELNVDGNKYVQQIANDQNSRASFVLSSYLHIGGIYKNSDVLHFLQSNRLLWFLDYHFSGCIDPTLRIASGQVLKIGQVVSGLDIDMAGCPSSSAPPSGCQSDEDRFESVFNGSDSFSFTDEGLDKFTEYMYSVEAYNSVGRTRSQWTLSRTLAGAPLQVPTPKVEKLGRGRVRVAWDAPDPSYYTGSITNFVVKFNCYNESNNNSNSNNSSNNNNNKISTIPQDRCFNNETIVDRDSYETTVTFALPYTKYEVRLVACTRGGCTESNGTLIETDPDAPTDVRPPFVLSSGPTHIVVGWFYPGRINGEMVGFSLNMRGMLVYSGLLTSFNASDLSVFTAYLFSLMVCNTIRCTTSEDIQLMTSQLPPTSVEAPSITLIDARKIRVDWTRPGQPNGILRFYLVHWSQNIDAPGTVAYNSSDPVITTTYLGDLTPDETYFISVSACTDAGCTRSKSSSLKMPQGIPEDVPPPVVVAVGATQLNVSWSAPGKPNGVIQNYLIFQDGSEMANVSSPGYRVVKDLQPWSQHIFLTKVCTAVGCSQSSEVAAFTLEAPPEGTVDLTIEETDDKDYVADNTGRDDDVMAKILNLKLVLKNARAKWNPVQKPNSLVTYWLLVDGPFYDLENAESVSSFDFKKKSTTKILFSTNSTTIPGSWVTVGDLLPLSTYRAYVNASNGVGFVLSNYVTMTTRPAEPDGLFPPLLTSPSSTSILASWKSPLIWNSNEGPLCQLQFRVTGSADDQIINLFPSPTMATSFLKRDLLPFTSYSFRLVAINSFGSKFSEWTALVTRQDVPRGLDSPLLLNITSRSITLSWQPPMETNGIITSYEIFGSNGVNETKPGDTLLAVFSDLTPFSNYSFGLRACTIAGCTETKSTPDFTTLPDVPEDVAIASIESPSPNSVLLTWKTPTKRNGIIVRHELWRSNECPPANDTGSDDSSDNSTGTSKIAVFPPGNSTSFVYLDDSRDILPFTCYSYQLIVYNHKFHGRSSWVSITTKAARPSGLLAPFCVAYNSTVVLVTWFQPKRPNGLLTSYVVVIGRLKRIQISNVSINSLEVSDLSAFTEYKVSVVACTDGGCTESPQCTVKTDPANPEGLGPPVATPVSQKYASLSWSKPLKPNGPTSNFELLRMTKAQPLIENPVGLGQWFSVYNGDLLTFDDTDLDTFTTYVYRLDFYNGFGRITSDDSSEITTFGGIPKLLPKINVTVFNYSLVRVSWEIPATKDIQGRVDAIEVIVFDQNEFNQTSPKPVYDDLLTRPADPSLTLPNQVDLRNLRPLTNYSVNVSFTMYGGGTYAGDIIYFSTPDRVPEDLPPPTFKVINDSSVQIFWAEPKVSKGPIVAYYIFVNERKVDPQTDRSGSYVLGNLMPYMVYNVSIEACNEHSCVISRASSFTTGESAPEYMRPPKVVEVKGQGLIRITWDPPERRNGIILTYELYKKQEYAPCVGTSPATEKCKYITCDALQAFCGDQCYSGYKICCDGALHSIKAGYECCGSSYVPGRESDSDVCCGGEFHKKMDDFQCCDGWYVKVLSGQICCKDPNEDRVVVDYGDVCCGSSPYHLGGSQLCCNGRLHSKWTRQCCGDKIIDSALVCCRGYRDAVPGIVSVENETTADDGLSYKWYARREGFDCCGQDYVSRSSSICCTDESFRWKVHSIPGGNQSASSSVQDVQKCCGLNLISDSLGCCSGSAYNTRVEVCADRDSAGMNSGCGLGKVCSRTPSTQSAVCGVCEFDWFNKRCYSAHEPRPFEEDGDGVSTNSPEKGCFGTSVLIYSGLNQQFEDESVRHFTNYSYHVIAINSVGIATSNTTRITTAPGIPRDVDPPEVEVDPSNPFYVVLTWMSPGQPNGPILWYAIMRDLMEISRISSSSSQPGKFSYLDNNAVVPFQVYQYSIQACTSSGCNNSRSVYVMTKQGPPDQFPLPTIDSLNSTSLEIKWYDPVKPNGFITGYVLQMVRPVRKEIKIEGGERISYGSYEPLSHSYVITDLTPFTNYSFNLNICTMVGCSTSDTFGGATAPGKPAGLKKPLLLIAGSTLAVQASWSPPALPNGNLLEVGLERSLGGMSYNRIFSIRMTSNSSVSVYDDFGVSPGNQYKYRVYFSTSAGTGYSPESPVFIPNSIPADVNPEFTASRTLSDTSVTVEWSSGINNRSSAVITGSYNILVITDHEVYTVMTRRMVPNATNYTQNITNLKAYTSYNVRIQACLPGSDNSCGTSRSEVTLRTDPAAPLRQWPPSAKSLSPQSILVWWNPPALPNGPIKKYLLYRNSKASPTPNSSPQIIFPTEILVADLPPNVTEFVDVAETLRPYSEYEYRILTVGAAGETWSNYTAVRTFESPPEVLSEPDATLVSSTEAEVCWKPPLKRNGLIVEYSLTFSKVVAPNSTTSNPPQVFVRLAGQTTCANVSGLDPYSSYTARVTAANGAGWVTSDWSKPLMTHQSSPSGVEPPTYEPVIGGRSVILTWRDPFLKNGIIVYYQVYLRNSSNATNYDRWVETSKSVYKGLNLQVEVGNLVPFAGYFSRLEACTSAGCSRSRWRSFFTAPAAPSVPPEVKGPPSSSVSSVSLEWSIPPQTYGPLTKLAVYRSTELLLRNTSVNGTGENETVNSGNPRFRRSTDEGNFELLYEMEVDADMKTFSYNDTSVQPFNAYKYFLRMFNKAGYIDSPQIEATTPQAPPSSIAPPIIELIPFQFDRLLITWSAPANPNGVIQNYQLNRSDLQISWHFSANASRRFVDAGLSAYTVYQYAITACTEGGCTASEFSSMRTLETAPASADPPQVLAATSTTLTVNWSAPRMTNGELNHYELKLNSRIIYSGMNTSYEIQNLVPYTIYSLSLVACTNGGCTESEATTATTDQAKPELLEAPELVVMSSSGIKVTWSAPKRPNGPMMLYELRRNGSLVYMVTPERTSANESTAFPNSGIASKMWTFLDANLSPATTYSYAVTAYNPIGQVSSQSSYAMTPPSAPIGLSPPILEAQSATSILVSWNPPLIPNGQITSYGVYLSLSNVVNKSDLTLPSKRIKRDLENPIVQSQGQSAKLVYRGLDLSTLVTNLEPFLSYSLSVQACTSSGCSMSDESHARTLAAPPTDPSPPRLASFSNLHNSDLLPEVGVEVTWLPPGKMNGILLQYMLFRKPYRPESIDESAGKLLYAGMDLNFTDLDPALLPFTFYQYRVEVVNSAGSSSSDWLTILTWEGTPKNISAPLVQNMSSKGAQIFQDPPGSPNGIIINYTLHLNNKPEAVSSGSQFFLHGLISATKYISKVVVCNKAACASSPEVEFLTNSEPPQGSSQPIVSNVTSDSLLVSWLEPTNKNGFNISYHLSYRTSCPLPYSLDINNQPVGYNCQDGSFLIGYTGSDQEFLLTKLIPYAKYDLQLVCCNEAGCSDATSSNDIITLVDAPQYRNGHPPIVERLRSYLTFNWSESFYPNGRIKSFSLYKDGHLQFSGSSLTFVDDLQEKNTSHLYRVTLATELGSVSSPDLLYDPSMPYLKETNSTGISEDVTLTLPSSEEPWRFYEEKWFIISIAVPSIGVVFLLFFLFVFCYCKCRRKGVPYSKQDGSGSSLSATTNRGSTMSRNELVYQVPVDFQEYTSPAFSDDWSSEPSSARSSPVKEGGTGKPDELQPWKYLKDRRERRQSSSPPFSPASSGESVTVAEVIGSNEVRGQRAEPLQKWNNDSDRIHIPDVTMPGVDEEEEDDDGLQNFVENVFFRGTADSGKLPDTKI